MPPPETFPAIGVCTSSLSSRSSERQRPSPLSLKRPHLPIENLTVKPITWLIVSLERVLALMCSLGCVWIVLWSCLSPCWLSLKPEGLIFRLIPTFHSNV